MTFDETVERLKFQSPVQRVYYFNWTADRNCAGSISSGFQSPVQRVYYFKVIPFLFEGEEVELFQSPVQRVYYFKMHEWKIDREQTD